MLNQIVELRSSKLPNIRTFNQELTDVKDKHSQMLKGYKRYKTRSDGACFYSCFAVHAFGDPEEVINFRKNVKNHIVDNILYYKEKISWPMKETIGVGKKAQTVVINDYKEWVEFLKKDRSDYLNSNSHDLFALSNLYNLCIKVFSFNSTGES